jgi:hypothetical protein
MVRIRDFIETSEGLIFSSVSYFHPRDKYCAYLRYYPDKRGDRGFKDKRYMKVTSTAEAEKYLMRNYPVYINASGQCVPRERAVRIYRPETRLREILAHPRDALEEKIRTLNKVFADIPEEKKGVTGSLLLGLHLPDSDIDFVVYGLENHRRARLTLKKLFEEAGDYGVRDLTDEEWRRVYEKRFPREKTLSYKEFLWHERRKYHRGVIDGTIIDILLVREPVEFRSPGDAWVVERGVSVRCRVVDAALAFDSPAVYTVALENGTMGELYSYTHTYAGQAFPGEVVEVRGVLEMTSNGQPRIVVGTTREAEGEYIKVIYSENI